MSIRDKINGMKHKRIKAFTCAALMLMGIGGGAKAQTTTNNDGNSKPTTELKAGFNNFSTLKINNDGTAFLNKFSPSLSGSVKFDNGVYGNFNVQELLVLKANSAMGQADITAINSSCLLEVGKQFGKDAKLTVFGAAGRSATEFAPNFLQTPGISAANDFYGGAFFNLSDKAVLGVKTKDGSLIELGMIGKTEEGFMVIPNPEHADLWGKVCKNIEAEGFKLSFTAAAQMHQDGQLAKVFGTMSAQNDKMAVTIGGNYDAEQKDLNGLLRVSYNFVESGMTIIGQATKSGETFYIDVAASKGQTQVYAGGQIGKDAAGNSVNGGHVGVSYSFGGQKDLRR